MKPLASFKPPPTNDETERMFSAVYAALNDIDRAGVPLVKTHDQGYGNLIDAYHEVAKRFQVQAKACGLNDWLRFTIVNRVFVLGYDEDRLDEARALYDEMEKLGYPAVDPLISLRMIWANRLHEADQIDEARSVALQLLADVAEYRKLHPNGLVQNIDDSLHQFRQRIGV